MKRIASVLTLIFLLTVPMLLMAHPGHEHSGGLLEVLSHYMVTYIAIGLPVVAFLVYFLVKRYRKAREQ
ncbi:MAG: hypothetical protein ACNS62_06305 [Candidatus Cyclobacteriaceae bacterium M3_2C_046]